MTVRPAAEIDLDSVRAISASYGNLVSWPRRPDYLDQELATGEVAVYEDEGEIVGFGAVIERSGVAHLADLFVRPDRLGRGIGKALLDELLPPDCERITFASGDPRAISLYARYGMSPLAPLFYLTGTSAAAMRLPDPAMALIEAESLALGQLDRNASGRDRLQDLRFLQRAGSRGFLGRRGEAVVGYGMCRVVDAPEQGRAGAFLGPIGARDAADAASTSLALLKWAAGQAGDMTVAVFGPNQVMPVLLKAGFHIQDMDTFMASDERLLDLRRYFPSPELG